MESGIGVIKPENVIKKQEEEYERQIDTLARTRRKYNARMKDKEDEEYQYKKVFISGFDNAYADNQK